LHAARWESVFVVIATVMLATNIAEILLSRGPAGASYAAQVRVAFMLIYVVAAVLLARSRTTLPTLLTSAPLLLVALAMPALSIVWSIDRGESIERVVAMIGTSLFGIYLGLRFTLGRLVFLLAVGLAVAAVLSIAVIFAVPSIGIAQDGPWAGTWIGFNFHKNGLGATAALGCILIGYAITDSRGVTRLALMAAFVLAAVLLAGSSSTTALIGAASAGLLTAWTRMVQRLPREGPVLGLLIGFGGNAWNADDLAAYLARRLADLDVVAFHYRGYAPSQGTPGEAAFFADALIIHDRLAERLRPERVLAAGFSLGSGVVAYLAAQRPLDGALLVTPFDSIEAVAASRYFWAPVRPLLRHPFRSDEYLRGLDLPAAVIMAEHDTVVPRERSDALVKVLARPVSVATIPGTHNGLYDTDAMDAALRRAIESVS